MFYHHIDVFEDFDFLENLLAKKHTKQQAFALSSQLVLVGFLAFTFSVVYRRRGTRTAILFGKSIDSSVWN
jgi:hypothetical protein